ncbi:MAG: iron transporter [Deltaproteobacteria bacterium]|nr:iron transporter [Deltaproteobacteria bacterium]
MPFMRAGNKIREGFVNGINRGWQGFLWMMKIIIPISFLTALLAWSGWIEKLDILIEPVMGLLNLPTMAAIPLLVGMLTGIYGGIAAMAVLPLSSEQMTIIAIFLLISHNLVQEGIIQGNSGINPMKATLFRIGASIITVLIVAQCIDLTDTVAVASGGASAGASQPFLTMVHEWGSTILVLVIKIFFIIMGILITLEIFKNLGWIAHVVDSLSPLLKVMGLGRKVGILWITAVVFGLSYGGAVIVEEAREEHLTKRDLETLHLSIGINHSMIEDPALFLPLGVGAFWLWVPRLLMALVAVRLLTLWQNLRFSSRN